MKPPADFDIRYSVERDVAALETWFSDVQERGPFPFETEDETAESLKNWIGFSKIGASLTGELGGEVCAVGTLFLMPYRKVAHHCSFYLIVDPKVRGRGIGFSMVKNLLHLARGKFRLESVQAEVIEPNLLLSILEKQGFVRFARQEGFIKRAAGTQARVLMEHFFA